MYLFITKRNRLIFIFLILLILVDLEVAKLIALLRISHNTQPISEIVLLQILLGKVLEVPEDGQMYECAVKSKIIHGVIISRQIKINEQTFWRREPQKKL